MKKSKVVRGKRVWNCWGSVYEDGTILVDSGDTKERAKDWASSGMRKKFIHVEVREVKP